MDSLLQERDSLIARLEEDLLAAKPGSRAEAPEPTFLGTADHNETSGETLSTLLNAPCWCDVNSAGCHSEASPVNAEEGGERTMVAVLCGQRDRFRKRVTELEEENLQVGMVASYEQGKMDCLPFQYLSPLISCSIAPPTNLISSFAQSRRI